MNLDEFVKGLVVGTMEKEVRPLVEKILGETLINVGGILAGPRPAGQEIPPLTTIETGSVEVSAEPPQISARMSALMKINSGDRSAPAIPITRAAKLLGFSVGTVYTMLRVGQLKSAGRRKPRNGRVCAFVTQESVDAYLGTVKPAPRKPEQLSLVKDAPEEMTYQEAADYLDVHKQSVNSAVCRGAIAKLRSGFIARAEVMRYAKERRKERGPQGGSMTYAEAGEFLGQQAASIASLASLSILVRVSKHGERPGRVSRDSVEAYKAKMDAGKIT